MTDAKYVIIGNSAAAVGCVTGIRQNDAASEIVVISKEAEHTYSRPLISYRLAGKVDDERMYYRGREYYAKNGITPILGVAAEAIDVDKRAVRTSDGKAVRFEKLLIAVGGRPIVPKDVPGNDVEGVFTFTTWEDARRIQAWIVEKDVKHAVVVGGGLIGLKSVEALVELGIETTMVELAGRILSATFDQAASDMAARYLERAGVEVRCNTTANEVESTDGRVSAVKLRDGSKMPCELIIWAIGVAPDLSVLEGTKIAAERGILVDDTMQTSAPGIYAAGDVAQARDLLGGKSRPVPILPAAFRQGYVAGLNMGGMKVAYRGALPMNAVDICGLPTISVGITAPGADDRCEVLSALDEEAGTYKKIVLRENRMVGAIFLGNIDRAGIATGLIRGKIDVSSFKNVLLNEDFGIISLPKEYRKHVVSGMGIEV